MKKLLFIIMSLSFTFADAINNNTTPIVTLEQGTEALRVAKMVIDSFDE